MHARSSVILCFHVIRDRDITACIISEHFDSRFVSRIYFLRSLRVLRYLESFLASLSRDERCNFPDILLYTRISFFPGRAL